VRGTELLLHRGQIRILPTAEQRHCRCPFTWRNP